MARNFKNARQINKLKVIEAADKLGISQPTLSAWEGERKSPSVEGLEKMADLYGVTTDYLLGRSEQINTNSSDPIPQDSLPIFHGKPVWSAKYGWLIVNAIKKLLLLPDGQTISFYDCGELFVSPDLLSESNLPTKKPLMLSEIYNLEKIWLEPISPDLDLRNELRGWYTVKNRFVENEFGNSFYLDTYNSKWLAFTSNI